MEIRVLERRPASFHTCTNCFLCPEELLGRLEELPGPPAGSPFHVKEQRLSGVSSHKHLFKLVLNNLVVFLNSVNVQYFLSDFTSVFG